MISSKRSKGHTNQGGACKPDRQLCWRWQCGEEPVPEGPGRGCNSRGYLRTHPTPTLQFETSDTDQDTGTARGNSAPHSTFGVGPVKQVSGKRQAGLIPGKQHAVPKPSGTVPAPPVSAVPPSLGMETVTHFKLHLSLL